MPTVEPWNTIKYPCGSEPGIVTVLAAHWSWLRAPPRTENSRARRPVQCPIAVERR
jgi:hypothetical protein